MKHINKILAALVVVVMLLYPAAYSLLVEQDESGRINLNSGVSERLPHYRFGGQPAEILFAPAQQLDQRFIRPGYWRQSVIIY
jgi:hypothetical protein